MAYRIKDIPNTASTLAADDYVAIDGATNNGRKFALKAALDALALPTQGGNTGKFLTTDGTNLSWGTVTAPAWGNITGTLSAQTDLQTALNGKAPATSGTAILYGNGSGGFSSVTIGTGLSFSGGTLSSTVNSAAWGNITGSIASQTDLQTALAAKAALAGAAFTGDISTAGNFTITGAISAAASTNLSLNGGSSGANMTLGQGANGWVVITPKGTGTILLNPNAANYDSVFVKNSNNTGYSSVVFMDDAGVAKGYVGYGNSGATYYTSKTYLYSATSLVLASGTFAALTLDTSQNAALTPTWANGATAFTALKVNVLDTASASGSLLLDLQKGSASQFSVAKDGTVTAANRFYLPAGYDNVYGFTGAGRTGLGYINGEIRIWNGGNPLITLGGGYINLGAGTTLSYSLGSDINGIPLNLTPVWTGYTTAVTGASGNGTTVTFNLNNSSGYYKTGGTIEITGVTPTAYNGNYVITGWGGGYVTVASTVTSAFVSAGTAKPVFSAPYTLNVTDTVSGDASKLLDLQVGGSSRFKVGKDSSTTWAGQSLTGTSATSLLDLSTTWNTTGAPSAIKLNVANATSGASSNLLDLQVNGVSKFTVDKNGKATLKGIESYGYDIRGSLFAVDSIETQGTAASLSRAGNPVLSWGFYGAKINNGWSFGLSNTTVASLPAASTLSGSLACVTDATQDPTSGGGAAPTGGGSYKRIVYSDGTSWFLVGPTSTYAGTLSDGIGNVRSIPQNAQTSAYVLAATDNGKHVSITTGGVTVNSGIFSAGQVVTIYNNSSSNQTITQGTSVTMYQAGTTNTGNRTLASYGVATVLCVASNTFVITGSGLS